MQEKWRRTQTATVIGSFVLSMVLASGTAVAQQQERQGSQMQQPSQQEMTQRHNRDIEDRVELRLARSSALAGSEIKVVVEDRIVVKGYGRQRTRQGASAPASPPCPGRQKSGG